MAHRVGRQAWPPLDPPEIHRAARGGLQKGGVPWLLQFEDFQKLAKDNVDLAVKSFGATSKSVQAIATEIRRLLQEGVRAELGRRREARRRQDPRQGRRDPVRVREVRL